MTMSQPSATSELRERLAGITTNEQVHVAQERFLDGIEPLISPIPSATLSQAVVEYREMLTLSLPERRRYLPWLFEGSNVMSYGPRGIGKTMWLLSLAASLSTGTDFLR